MIGHIVTHRKNGIVKSCKLYYNYKDADQAMNAILADDMLAKTDWLDNTLGVQVCDIVHPTTNEDNGILLEFIRRYFDLYPCAIEELAGLDMDQITDDNLITIMSTAREWLWAVDDLKSIANEKSRTADNRAKDILPEEGDDH